MPELTTVGLRLKQARRLRSAQLGRDVSQAEVAESAGVGQAAVSRWEAGALEPNIETIRALAVFLGVTPAWLAFGDNGESTPLVVERRDAKPSSVVKLPEPGQAAKKGGRRKRA